MWDFVSSGKAGDFSQGDFDALFASIDLDKTGSVNFLEFCTFLGDCHEDFERLKNRESVIANRASIVRSSRRLFACP